MDLELESTHLASFGRRTMAFLLDCLIMAIPCAIGAHLIPIAGGFVVWFLYHPILESSEIRATLGKHLVGIQVCDLTGRRISLRAAIVRNLLKWVSLVLAFIGFIFALFTPKRQALHDFLADTLVVYGRSSRSIADAWVASMRELFQMTPLAESSRPSDGGLEQLERLQALREKGALSEDEFQAQKQKILSPQL